VPGSARPSNLTVTVTAQTTDRKLTGVTSLTGGAQDDVTVPVIFGNVSSSADFNGQPSPGELVTIGGTQFAGSAVQSSVVPRPVNLQDTSVFLGETALPMLYASPGQINAIVPYGITPNMLHPLVVRRGQRQSAVQRVMVVDAQPAVFTTDGSGTGQGHIYTHPEAPVLAKPGNPATAGDALVIYCSGLGAVNPPAQAGVPAPVDQLSRTTKAVSVTIGGVPAQVLFAGLTPTQTGLYQVNAIVPSGVPPGDAVSVLLTVGSSSSSPVTMALK